MAKETREAVYTTCNSYTISFLTGANPTFNVWLKDTRYSYKPAFTNARVAGDFQ